MRRRDFLQAAARGAAAFGLFRTLPLRARPAPPSGDAAGGLAALRERYFVRSLQLYPVTSTYLGGDGYSPTPAAVNGTLRDYRPEALRAESEFYREVDRERRAIDPTRLGPADRIDYEVLEAQVGFVLHQLEERRHYQRAVDSYVAEPFRGVDWQLQQMSGPEGERGGEAEWELVIRRVEAIPRYLEAARANLRAGKEAGNLPDRRLVQRDGVDGSAANQEYFRTTLPRTAAAFLGRRPFAPATLARLTRASAAAADAWRGFGRFLVATYDPSDTDRFAAGEEEYDWRLAHCLRESRRAAELYDYGAEQVALYERRLFAVAREVAQAAKLGLGFGSEPERRRSTRAVMEHLSQDAPRDDDELLSWYRETGKRAVTYGFERRLFDIPKDYRLEVVPTPPVLRSTIDAAYYPAPPFKRTGVGRFYLTPTGNDPAALKLNNRASVADTAVHEGFPGHDWHYKYMSRYAAEISNIRWLTPGAVEDSSSMWEDSMAAEGWALYAEDLMAEPAPGRPHGFYTAAERLYELQGQLLRAVRVRVDVGLHTARMSFGEAVDYFTAHVSFYPEACRRARSDPTARAVCDNARRAIYRYSKWPTQAITYNLGKAAIVSLREESRRRLGTRFSLRAFHERLMRMGTIPVGYFREEFLRSADPRPR